MKPFEALMVDQEDGRFTIGVRELEEKELPAEGEVLIRVLYSGLNYKDGLACRPNGGIVRSYPHIPGYSSLARVPADWVVPLPPELEPREAMAIGTAGLTAAISIERMEHNGLHPRLGPVLVTGATGGVGSCAVALLAARGYDVAASTGKAAEHDYLRALGARTVVGRLGAAAAEGGTAAAVRPLEKQQWAGAVDPVGGSGLAFVLASIRYGGSVAVSGLTGGGAIPTTVHPFILRGVNLLGIDSVQYPIERRRALWERMAADLKPAGLLEWIGSRTIRLQDVPQAAEELLAGQVRGRIVVEL
ncbi:zinc-binding dehydrogenase [Paenibacillus piri]|uniref:Oxidoreductase n=1 Tax=Paenibacillus piri TaxID=2547395 RepID=A0A4R5KET3_9BACL|nr:zinc-binding dehydrogenase [Paenibacillus piri]TDF93746.1 oxidoreductase [Paenibacillus piri]